MRDRRGFLRALRADVGNVATVAATVPVWTWIVLGVSVVLLVAWWVWFRGEHEDEEENEEDGPSLASPRTLTPRQIAAMKSESGRVKDKMFGRHATREIL